MTKWLVYLMPYCCRSLIAVCLAHTSNTDVVSTGNGKADAAAKASTANHDTNLHAFVSDPVSLLPSLLAVQSFAPTEERTVWQKFGARFHDGIGWGPDNKPCLLKHCSRILQSHHTGWTMCQKGDVSPNNKTLLY